MLTTEQIIGRLEAAAEDGDSEVVDDIYDLAQKQLVAEDMHGAKLDARATSLFGAVGFSMTVAFSFGGWALLDHAYKVPFGRGIAVAFVLALGVGLVASWHALQGLMLRSGQKSVDEEDVFHAGVVAKGKKRVDFRIHLATHFWLVFQARYARNESRAETIRLGQNWFMGFLVAILALSGATTVSAILRPPDPLTAAPCLCAQTPSVAALTSTSSSPHVALPSASISHDQGPPPSSRSLTDGGDGGS